MTRLPIRERLRCMNDIGHALDLYAGELARLGRTANTRRKYLDVLLKFADTVEHKQLGEITPYDCRAFLARWNDAEPATMALSVSILTRFFAFLLDEELIPVSPMQRIARPPLKRPEDLDVVTVGADDVGRLFAACQDEQEFLCVALLAYLGPRRNAAAMLRWGDVDFDKRSVRFREKGGKVIVKPLPDELAEILYTVAATGRVPAGPNDYVIPNRRAPKRNPRSHKIVYATVKRVAERAGVTTHVHALRAAFAVHYLETHPGDLDALQKLLGHTRAETTQVYLRRQDRFAAMERVRDLSWGSVFPPNAVMPPAGFEPALPPTPDRKRDRAETDAGSLPDALHAKLAQLRDRERA